MSAPLSLDALHEATKKLAALLEDRYPGRGIWRQAVNDAIKTIAEYQDK